MAVDLGEAAVCSSPSSLFRGACVIDRNCESVCEQEGFDDGKCKGKLIPKCICYKPCVDAQSPPDFS